MTLGNIIEQIKQAKQFANEDVESGPVQTMIARRGRKIQANETLKRLKIAYKNHLRNSALFLLVTGSQKDSLVEIASKEFTCFSADPDAFYKELAKRVPEELYKNHENIGSVFGVASRHLEDMAMELDITEYNAPIFRSQNVRSVRTMDELVSFLKIVISDQVGSEIVGIKATSDIADQALAAGYVGKVTPIIMSVDEDSLDGLKLALQRLTKNVFVISAGKTKKKMGAGTFLVKEVSKETTEKVLTNVKNHSNLLETETRR